MICYRRLGCGEQMSDSDSLGCRRSLDPALHPYLPKPHQLAQSTMIATLFSNMSPLL